MSTQETKPEPRRPKLRLPFDNRREDAGEWAFDHRAGLCVTLIAYLLLAIAFVGAKIVVGGRPAAQGFYIDLQQLEQLAAEKERLEREVRRRQQQEPIDWKSIRNDVSNENAKLDESLRDDRGTNTAALNDAADAAQERMRANREAYERGLAEAEAIRRRRERTDERGESSDRKVQGRVTVSFSLVDPVRHARHLVVPAYQCEGGGEVVVRITVNRAGEVTHASVASGGDDCMRETAVRAARNSVFDINDAAGASLAPPRSRKDSGVFALTAPDRRTCHEEGGGIPKTNRNDETIDCLLRPGLRILRRPQGYRRQRRRPSGAHRPEMERNERCPADHGRDHPLYGLPHGGSEIRLLQRLVPDPQMRIGKGAFDLRRLPRGRRLPDRRRDLPACPRCEGESAGSGDLLNLSGSARRASAHRSASPKNA